MRTTAAGSAETVTATSVETPPLLAAICVRPAPMPVTIPWLDTWATREFSEAQKTCVLMVAPD
jgi:hypothetical protein